MTDSEKIENLLTVFYENHGNLRGYVFASTRSYHGSEEVLQSVAIKIAQAGAAFDADRPALPWIMGITKNQIKQWYQKNRRDARHISFEVIDEYLPKLAVFSAEQMTPRREALDSCMQNLPANQRWIVELKYVDNFNCTQIAGTLGKSVQSIYSLLKRLKAELRKCIEFKLQRPEVF